MTRLLAGNTTSQSAKEFDVQERDRQALFACEGGIFPVPGTPIYAGAKAALVHFVRSIEGQLKARGIRIVALCPQVRLPAAYG